MDKDFEENICRNFFDKRVSDRLTFELRSLKKRCEFIRKLSHTAEKYLNVKKIFRQFETPPDPELIKGFLGSEMCYVISHGDMTAIFLKRRRHLMSCTLTIWCICL